MVSIVPYLYGLLFQWSIIYTGQVFLFITNQLASCVDNRITQASRQLLLYSCASRLGATIWRALVDVGITVRLPTKRGCRRGARKQRTLDSLIGHRPPTGRPHTRCNNNHLIQVPTVSWDSAKFGLINARSLRNKSLFVRNYVEECSLDIVALTETWLTDEDTNFELCF